MLTPTSGVNDFFKRMFSDSEIALIHTCSLIQELHRPAVWVKTLVWCWGSHSRGLKFVISVQANDWVGAIPVFSRKSIKAHKTLTLSGVYLAYFRQGKGKYSVTSRLNFDCVGIKTMK